MFTKVYSIPSPYVKERRIPVSVKYVPLWPEWNMKKKYSYIYNKNREIQREREREEGEGGQAVEGEKLLVFSEGFSFIHSFIL